MHTPISSIMTTNIMGLPADCTADLAQAFLSEHKLNFTPVLDINNKCFGVISALDLLHLHVDGVNLKAIQAWEICTHQLIEVTPYATIKEAVELMIAESVDHIIVCEQGTVRGIVSGIDVLREYTKRISVA